MVYAWVRNYQSVVVVVVVFLLFFFNDADTTSKMFSIYVL